MQSVILYIALFTVLFSNNAPKHDLKSVEIYALPYETQYQDRMSVRDVKHKAQVHFKDDHITVQTYSDIETDLKKLKKNPTYQHEDDYRAVVILHYKKITRKLYIASNGCIMYYDVLYLPQPDLLKVLYSFIPEKYRMAPATEAMWRQKYPDDAPTAK